MPKRSLLIIILGNGGEEKVYLCFSHDLFALFASLPVAGGRQPQTQNAMKFF